MAQTSEVQGFDDALGEGDEPPWTEPQRRTGDFLQRLMWVLWPAFLVGGLLEMLVFSVVDPSEVSALNGHELGRTAIYTLGFFAFWGLAALSSALTVFLARSPWEVNRCPYPDASDRPVGCPKRC